MDSPIIKYAIRVEEQLGSLEAAFDDLTIHHDASGTTLIGDFADQAALHGVLARIRDLCLTLTSIVRIAPESKPIDRSTVASTSDESM